MQDRRSAPAQDPKSRRLILELLKQHGPLDAKSLAERIGLTAMAVRQHLYQMQSERLVTYEEEPRPVGRPAKLWRLTADANRFFPDAHAELCVHLIGSLTETFGNDALEKLIASRSRQQIAQYLSRMPQRASLRKRLDILAGIRSEEGYMAEVIPQRDGSLLLVENHCPICAAATACNGLCAGELHVFQSVLGDKVVVERTEHMLADSRRCSYRVRRQRERPPT